MTLCPIPLKIFFYFTTIHSARDWNAGRRALPGTLTPPPVSPNRPARLVTLPAAEGAGAAEGQRGRRGEGSGPAMAPPPGQTPLPDWDGLKLRVRTLIASHRVMIFSKSYCPYCNKVRRRRPWEPARRCPPRGLSPHGTHGQSWARAGAGQRGWGEAVWGCGGGCCRRHLRALEGAEVAPSRSSTTCRPWKTIYQAWNRAGIRGSSLSRWERDVWPVLQCACSSALRLPQAQGAGCVPSHWKFGYHIGVQLAQSCCPREG